MYTHLEGNPNLNPHQNAQSINISCVKKSQTYLKAAAAGGWWTNILWGGV